MIHQERTIQQLDPLLAVRARPFTLAANICMVSYAIAMTWFSRVDIVSPEAAILAVLAVAVVAAMFAVVSSQRRAVVRRSTFVLLISTAYVAMVLSTLSLWGRNVEVRDDWGSVVIGALILEFVPYRPARELAVAGILVGIFTGFLVLLQVTWFISPVPPIVFVIVAVTPIVAMSFAASAFSHVAVRATRQWRTRTTVAMQVLADEVHDGLARSVQQDRVTTLNRDVVPFFVDILDQGTVFKADRDHARFLSDSIRSSIIAEVDRSWLDGVVGQVGSTILGSRAPSAEVVRDDERLALSMTTEQRAATRAMIAELFGLPGFDPDHFTIQIGRTADSCVAAVQANFATGEAAVRSALAPYLAVLRAVFLGLDVNLSDRTLTLRFFYDEH